MEKSDGRSVVDVKSDSYATKKQTNTFLEINGEIVGVVIQELNETLLIRKGRPLPPNTKEEFFATEKAVFVSKNLVNQYWVKLVEGSHIIQSDDMVLGRNLVREFFNM